jgi:hypothetical protein
VAAIRRRMTFAYVGDLRTDATGVRSMRSNLISTACPRYVSVRCPSDDTVPSTIGANAARTVSCRERCIDALARLRDTITAITTTTPAMKRTPDHGRASEKNRGNGAKRTLAVPIR